MKMGGLSGGMDIRDDWFGLSAIAIVCLITGLIAGGATAGGSSTADAILDRYPIELSLAGQHRHDVKNVPADEAPGLDIEVMKDPMMSTNVNVFINTTDFTFAPESVSSEHVLGEGHAHVFVDDVKVSRSYGPWYHIPRLKPGNHTIKVTLNTNDHMEYGVNGTNIMDTETITIE
jgi:hypothetical protein